MSAEAENEKAFANMEEASDKKELVDTEEYKYFRDYVFYQEEREVLCGFLWTSGTGTHILASIIQVSATTPFRRSFKCQHMIFQVQADAHPSRNIFSRRSICTSTCAR